MAQFFFFGADVGPLHQGDGGYRQIVNFLTLFDTHLSSFNTFHLWVVDMVIRSWDNGHYSNKL